MRKSIIFVIDTLRMGGAEKSLISLLKSLDPARVDVDLFVFEGGGILEKEVPEWVNIIHGDSVTRGMTLELRKYFKDILKAKKFRAAFYRLMIKVNLKRKKNRKFSWNRAKKYIPMQEKKYDVAISYLEGSPAFYVIDKVIAKKKIAWIHKDFSKEKLLDIERKYYEQFNWIVTISKICQESLIQVFSSMKSKICVVENIVNADDVQKKAMEMISEQWDDSKINIVSVGRLEYIKGMDIAAETAKILKDRNISFCWHVYGKGLMKEELELFIKNNQLEKEFILEGIRENPYPYMKKADIVVQPSRSEGKSIVLDEAKILGKAIVVTKYPSVYDQIRDRKTGLITEINSNAIAEGIEEIIQNKELKRVLEKNSVEEKNGSYSEVEKFYQMIN